MEHATKQDIEMQDFLRKKQAEKHVKERTHIRKIVNEYKENKLVRRERELEEKLMIEEMNRVPIPVLSNEEKARLMRKEMSTFMRKMNPIIQKKNAVVEVKERMDRIHEINQKRFEGVEGRWGEETKCMVSKARDKFDYKNDKGKWADNMAGDMVRNQGRAIVGWRGSV